MVAINSFTLFQSLDSIALKTFFDDIMIMNWLAVKNC